MHEGIRSEILSAVRYNRGRHHKESLATRAGQRLPSTGGGLVEVLRKSQAERVAVEALRGKWAKEARGASLGIKLAPDRTAEERAQWLLEFAVLDLDTLSEGDWLNLGEAVKNFITPIDFPSIGHPHVPLPAEHVRDLQRWLMDGLAALVALGSWSIRAKITSVLRFSDRRLSGLTMPNAWAGASDLARPVSPAPNAWAGASDLARPVSPAKVSTAKWSATTFKVMAHQVLLASRHRLRVCMECQRPFIARKGQEYCTPRCSQAVRTRRFMVRHSARAATRRKQK